MTYQKIKNTVLNPLVDIIVFATVAIIQVLINYVPQIEPVQYYAACGVAFVLCLVIWLSGRSTLSFLDLLWAVILAIPANFIGVAINNFLTK